MIVYNLPEILAEIIRYREMPQEKTQVFNEMKHNRDLCSRTERQLNYMLQNFVKYYAVAYDIQGPHDQGADVVLQVRPQAEEKKSEFSVIVLQIKSYDDFQDKNYLTILRAQYQYALAHYGQSLEHYYILLCTDQVEHLQKIRNVKQAFSTLTNATVISPTYSLSFLSFSSQRIGLIVQDLLREEDIVVTIARKITVDFTPTQNAIRLFLIYCATFRPNEKITPSDIKNSSFINEVYKACPDYDDYFVLEERVFYERSPQEFNNDDNPFDRKLKDLKRDIDSRLLDDIDHLDDGTLYLNRSTESIAIELSEFASIQSLLLDAHIRYGYNNDELLRFLFGILGVAERYGLNLIADDPL